MNEIDWLKSLDRERDVPAIDVASSVLGDIRRRQNDRAEDSLALPALFATLAGSVAALVAFEAFTMPADPFATFLDSFQLVLQ